jgi:hypothetical protein
MCNTKNLDWIRGLYITQKWKNSNSTIVQCITQIFKKYDSIRT